MQRKRIYVIGVCLLLLAFCRDPYNPPVVNANLHYLVVDGTINSGVGSLTSFRLSHTQNINDSAAIAIEANATVVVESDNGAMFPLGYIGDGYYTAADLPLQTGTQYRLRIVTVAGKQYVSDFTPLKNVPPIDSVSYDFKNTDLQLYVSAHDPANNTHYYRWSFQETWEYHAAFRSDLIYVDSTKTLDFRPTANSDALFYCWHDLRSTQILVSTSTQLSQDVIAQFPINHIKHGDDRLSVLYSILVTQSALTQDAYNYWVNVKKITEQIGDIFGPLPSEIHGNIHNIADASEPVIGYVCASTAVQQRIFIKKPADWIYFSSCLADTVDLKTTTVANAFGSGINYPLYYGDPFQTKVLEASGGCVNCAYSGGTPARPPFWP